MGTKSRRQDKGGKNGNSPKTDRRLLSSAFSFYIDRFPRTSSPAVPQHDTEIAQPQAEVQEKDVNDL
jgi:hypothetical protein